MHRTSERKMTRSRESGCQALRLGLGLATLTVLIPVISMGHPCAACHSKQVSGYAQSGMAHSMDIASRQESGTFRQAVSGAQFTVSNTRTGPWQTLETASELISLPLAYTVGSGSHAFGYIVQRGDHLFQSPLSYYTNRRAWDMAPGYEESKKPDFSRPVTVECLFCHSDKPLPIANTLNSYESPPFKGMGIQCDRCHGSSEAHLKKPVPGSIINPAKLEQSARDSVCEQCHLTGEARVPNPGKTITEFRPGQRAEDVYTVYVVRHDPEKTIKVVSQAEQLALSTCARKSAGKLWCGTCHDPHAALVQSAGYYREKCLSCHAATLSASHAAPTQNCVGCHMVKLPAKDGGHTAFTDHRINRRPAGEGSVAAASELVAWRNPDAPLLQRRNLALALVTTGMEGSNSEQVIRGYRMLNRIEKELPNDAAVLTALGTILLTAKQPAEARLRFEHALELRAGYAPFEVNLASALMDEGKLQEGMGHLERAVQLDPLLWQGVELLRRAYIAQGQNAKAEVLMGKYRADMGITEKEAK